MIFFFFSQNFQKRNKSRRILLMQCQNPVLIKFRWNLPHSGGVALDLKNFNDPGRALYLDELYIWDGGLLHKGPKTFAVFSDFLLACSRRKEVHIMPAPSPSPLNNPPNNMPEIRGLMIRGLIRGNPGTHDGVLRQASTENCLFSIALSKVVIYLVFKIAPAKGIFS